MELNKMVLPAAGGLVVGIVLGWLVFGLNGGLLNIGETVNLDDETEKASYSLGVSVATNVRAQGMEAADPQAFAMAVEDVFADNETALTVDEANTFLTEFFGTRQQQQATDNLAEAEAFLEDNAGKEGVVTLPSGLQYEILNEGEGASPTTEQTVTVNYTGSFVDGEVFDSTYDTGTPATFEVGRVIPGWQEALTLMKPGAKWKLYIPPDLAYGEQGSPPAIGPNAVLIFETELVSVQDAGADTAQ